MSTRLKPRFQPQILRSNRKLSFAFRASWRQFDSTRQETAALPGPSSRLFSDAHYHGFWDRSSSRCLGISDLITEPEGPSFISSTATHYRFNRRCSGHLAAFLFDLASPSFADFVQLIREEPRSTHRGPNASPITLHSRAPARRKAISASTMAIAATYFMAALALAFCSWTRISRHRPPQPISS